MTVWQKVYREAISPQLSTRALLALKNALALDDPALIQGKATEPPLLQPIQDAPVQAARAFAYAGWQGEGLATVAEEDSFAQICFRADKRCIRGP
jgi:hypothetical protein